MTDRRPPARDLLLPRLRCPDCFCESLTASRQADQNLDRSVALECDDCGRMLRITDNLLHALPSEIAGGGTANLEHYDEISEAEENHLVLRSRTRNHRAKTGVVLSALGLTGSQAKMQSHDITQHGVTLEIGAGSGAHGAEIVRAGSSYVGLDLSTGSLSRATHHHPELGDAGLAAGDATRTPFRAEVFDRVFGVAMLHHLPEPEKGIGEAFRMLKTGGRFCFVEPKRFYPVHFIQALRFPETEVSAMKMSVSRVTRWVQEAGAQEVEASYTVFTPNGPAWIEPLWEKIDALCQQNSLLHTLSVMFCVHGRK